MYYTEGNRHHLCTHDNFFDHRPRPQHIHIKEKKQVLQCTSSKMLFVKRNLDLFKI